MSNTLTILFFGQLTDLTGSSRTEMAIARDTDELHEQLLKAFPLLNRSTYVMTVDRKIVRQNTPIGEHAEIALLPPFSGG